MKRFLTLLLAAATLLSSCTQNTEVDTNIVSTPFSFYVDFDSTRIEFTDSNTYSWNGGEILGTYITSAATTINAPASVTLKDGRAVCTTMVSGVGSGDKLRVYYPWNELNDLNSFENITVTVPTAQKQTKAGDFTVESMPMVGSTITANVDTAPTVYMRPLAGFIRIKVYSSTDIAENLHSVAYIDTEAPVAGDCSVNISEIGISDEIMVSGDSNNVTLSVTEPYAVGTSLEQTEPLYMVLATSKTSGTLKITTNKAIYTYEDYAINIERNKYYDLNIDLSKATDRQTIDAEWGGGSGTRRNPYLIRSAADLSLLASLVNSSETYSNYAGKNYLQICDIDLKDIAVNPIGNTGATAFTGSYDGGGYTISNANITPTATDLPCALFGYTTCATISNLTVKDVTVNSTAPNQSALIGYAVQTTVSGCAFEGTTYFYNYYSGGFIGYMNGGTLSNCRMDGHIENNASDNTLSSESHCAVTAGCVGYATNATIENCVIGGDIATRGRYAAGVVAQMESSTVRNCHILSTCEVANVATHIGGITALMKGNNSLIEGCRFDGRVNSSYYPAGAIVGSMVAGKVYNSISTLNSLTTSYEGYTGGIAGQIYTATATDIALIDHCAAYGQVEGAYNVGGIVGYARNATAGGYAGVTNCAAMNSKLISRGANNNGYNLIGGIAGWLDGNNKSVVIACCVSRPKEIHAAPVSKNAATKEIIAGIVACPHIDNAVIAACYTDITRDRVLYGFEPLPAPTESTIRQGALFGYAYRSLSLSNSYYIASLDMHGSIASGKSLTVSNCSAVTAEQMTDGTLLNLLNTASSAYTPATGTPTAARWVAGADGYPTIENLPADTTPVNAEPKKVSVIGDSISTFRGYIPYSYSTYYPRTDGTFISVADMYWYQLIYKHMTNARLERNIAYSGSCVTNTDTTVDTYFAKRFMDQNGVGDADIVIIHGGTNDWRKLSCDLVDGLAIDATTGPTDDQLSPLLATADAATTRAEIEALNDTTFCEAYIKLIKLVKERNPKVKIVCIIGDYINVGIEQATLKIAAHYDNVKCVDLLAINGYNDQTCMPKLYYSSSNKNQCHPNQQAMAFIADYIYKQLGSWLEE